MLGIWLEGSLKIGLGLCVLGFVGQVDLADDVRMATREVMGLGKVDFWEESFTW
jgi:hypothetical protein